MTACLDNTFKFFSFFFFFRIPRPSLDAPPLPTTPRFARPGVAGVGFYRSTAPHSSVNGKAPAAPRPAAPAVVPHGGDEPAVVFTKRNSAQESQVLERYVGSYPLNLVSTRALLTPHARLYPYLRHTHTHSHSHSHTLTHTHTHSHTTLACLRARHLASGTLTATVVFYASFSGSKRTTRRA